MKLSLRLTVIFVIVRYTGMEKNPFTRLTGKPALNLEERY